MAIIYKKVGNIELGGDVLLNGKTYSVNTIQEKLIYDPTTDIEKSVSSCFENTHYITLNDIPQGTQRKSGLVKISDKIQENIQYFYQFQPSSLIGDINFNKFIFFKNPKNQQFDDYKLQENLYFVTNISGQNLIFLNGYLQQLNVLTGFIYNNEQHNIRFIDQISGGYNENIVTGAFLPCGIISSNLTEYFFNNKLSKVQNGKLSSTLNGKLQQFTRNQYYDISGFRAWQNNQRIVYTSGSIAKNTLVYTKPNGQKNDYQYVFSFKSPTYKSSSIQIFDDLNGNLNLLLDFSKIDILSTFLNIPKYKNQLSALFTYSISGIYIEDFSNISFTFKQSSIFNCLNTNKNEVYPTFLKSHKYVYGSTDTAISTSGIEILVNNKVKYAIDDLSSTTINLLNEKLPISIFNQFQHDLSADVIFQNFNVISSNINTLSTEIIQNVEDIEYLQDNVKFISSTLTSDYYNTDRLSDIKMSDLTNDVLFVKSSNIGNKYGAGTVKLVNQIKSYNILSKLHIKASSLIIYDNDKQYYFNDIINNVATFFPVDNELPYKIVISGLTIAELFNKIDSVISGNQLQFYKKEKNNELSGTLSGISLSGFNKINIDNNLILVQPGKLILTSQVYPNGIQFQRFYKQDIILSSIQYYSWAHKNYYKDSQVIENVDLVYTLKNNFNTDQIIHQKSLDKIVESNFKIKQVKTPIFKSQNIAETTENGSLILYGQSRYKDDEKIYKTHFNLTQISSYIYMEKYLSGLNDFNKDNIRDSIYKMNISSVWENIYGQIDSALTTSGFLTLSASTFPTIRSDIKKLETNLISFNDVLTQKVNDNFKILSSEFNNYIQKSDTNLILSIASGLIKEQIQQSFNDSESTLYNSFNSVISSTVNNYVSVAMIDYSSNYITQSTIGDYVDVDNNYGIITIGDKQLNVLTSANFANYKETIDGEANDKIITPQNLSYVLGDVQAIAQMIVGDDNITFINQINEILGE